MAKKAYVGINNVARKIKKGYVGVDDVARKIKKAYIGIGGVARPCWSGSGLEYYGTISGLSMARSYLAATTVGNYALFGGGMHSNWFDSTNNGYKATVDAYNTSLTRSIPTPLSAARYYLNATAIGSYALFGGGWDKENGYATVDAYNTSLTRSIPTPLSAARGRGGATTVGGYALFGGGGAEDFVSTVDAYNTSLTRSIPTPLSVARNSLAGTTVGNYALFGGGQTSISTVDAYNTSLTRSIPTPLHSGGAPTVATSVGIYALFAYSSTVTIYDSSLTQSYDSKKNLSSSRTHLAATTVGDYALFGGGEHAGRPKDAVDAYIYTP